MRNLHKGEREREGKKAKNSRIIFQPCSGKKFLVGRVEGWREKGNKKEPDNESSYSFSVSLAVDANEISIFPLSTSFHDPPEMSTPPHPFSLSSGPLPPIRARNSIFASARINRESSFEFCRGANWYHAIVISFVSREIPLHRYSVFLNRSFYPLIFIFRKLVKNSRVWNERLFSTISISIISFPLSVMNFSRIYHGTRERSRKHGNFPANEQMDILIDYTSFWWMVGDFWSCDEIRNDGLVQIATR